MTRETAGVPAGATVRTDIDCIAHRGFAGRYPENTLAAMRGASGGDSDSEPTTSDRSYRGADAIEIDVMPAAGGEPIVFHDLTLGRLTDAPSNLRRRMVWEMPLETLRGFSVLDSGEAVPSLAEVVDAIPADVRVNVELKHPGTGQPRRELHRRERSRGRERWSGFVERVVGVLDDHGSDALVASSYEGALAAMRDVAPSIPLAYFFWNSVEEGLSITRRYDCEAVHPALDMVGGTSLFNSGYTPTGPHADVGLVERAHEEGRAVNVWTVTTREQASALERAGVDGILADYPGLLEATETNREAEAGDVETPMAAMAGEHSSATGN